MFVFIWLYLCLSINVFNVEHRTACSFFPKGVCNVILFWSHQWDIPLNMIQLSDPILRPSGTSVNVSVTFKSVAPSVNCQRAPSIEQWLLSNSHTCNKSASPMMGRYIKLLSERCVVTQCPYNHVNTTILLLRNPVCSYI